MHLMATYMILCENTEAKANADFLHKMSASSPVDDRGHSYVPKVQCSPVLGLGVSGMDPGNIRPWEHRYTPLLIHVEDNKETALCLCSIVQLLSLVPEVLKKNVR